MTALPPGASARPAGFRAGLTDPPTQTKGPTMAAVSLDDAIRRMCVDYCAKVAVRAAELAEVGLGLELVEFDPADAGTDLTTIRMRGTYRIVPLPEETR